MKIYFFTLIFLFTATISFGQVKPKPKPKEKPQTEMEKMMKEAQMEMDNLDPETLRMMDSMGIKRPSFKNVPTVSNQQMKEAIENENRIVPKKDVARINTALAVTVTNAEMNTYINKIYKAVLLKLSPVTKTKGAEIYNQLKNLHQSAANTAVSFWMDGKPTLALYLMGEACINNPADAVNLNNYASFLTMCGAEELALPILVNLNKKFPKNSTILNNITQAWLGLGDIPRAEKYADSTLNIYAYHPQANMAKCVIEESKGNIPAAIAAAKKSIRKSYSSEKENKLKKLGYTLKSEDLDWNRPMPKDALGLGKFKWPDYPVAVEQNELLEKEWKNFKDECQQKINELEIKQQEAEQYFVTQSEVRRNQMILASQNGQYVQLMPGYAAKAILKLGPSVNDVNGNMSFVFAQALEPVVKALAAVEGYENILNEKQKLLDDKYEDQVGEGKPNPFAAICKDENAIRTEFLNNANGGLKNAYRIYLNYVSRRTSDLLYYYQYTLWPEQFELVKVNAQIAWLTQIKDQRVFFKSKSDWCIPTEIKPKGKDSLQNFDDVACKYVSTMDLGCYKIISSCSNLTGEFDCGGIQIDYKSNVETGRYSGTAIVGVSKGIDGPLGMEAEATLGGLVEWDNSGFTDYGAIARVAANAAGQTIAGAEVRATVNSGVSTSGSTILQGNK